MKFYISLSPEIQRGNEKTVFPFIKNTGRGEIFTYFSFPRIAGGLKKTRYFHSRITGGEIPSYGGDFGSLPCGRHGKKDAKGLLVALCRSFSLP